jgi:hypothetical protein
MDVPSGGMHVQQQNSNSTYLNSVAQTIGAQGGPVYPKAIFEAWGSIKHLSEQDMRLVDAAHFDFRPSSDSPLLNAGVVHLPEAPPRKNGRAPDVGAYQSDDEQPWVPGCTFRPDCGPY